MSTSNKSFIDDHENTNDVPPPDVAELFEGDFDSAVEKYAETNPNFCFNSYLETEAALLKKRKTASKKLQKQIDSDLADLDWMKANYLKEARNNMLLWEHPRSVHSLKAVLVDGKEEWTGLVWCSPTEQEESELTDAYLKFLLTPEALRQEQFRSETFVPLLKYDRLPTLNETHFHGVRRLDYFRFKVLDCVGRRVVVSSSWALKKIPKEAI